MESTFMNDVRIAQKTVESQATSEEQGVQHELKVQETNLPDEGKNMMWGMTVERMFLGDKSYLEQVVETKLQPVLTRNPVWNREVLGIQDSVGNRIYAWAVREENQKRRIEMCQHYRNGSFSPVFAMPQGEMCMAVMEDSLKDDKARRRADKFFKRIYQDYLDSLAGDIGEVLRIKEVIKILASRLTYLPEYNDDLLEVQSMELYQKVIEVISCFSSQIISGYKDFYPLSEEEILYLAHSLGMEKFSLLRKMEKCQLLYRSPSSSRYQNNVRMNGEGQDSFTEWRYCVKRIKEWENDNEAGENDF